ncbi:MAG: polymer-forming cytoskeletal protein [Pseudomonadota bacterium]
MRPEARSNGPPGLTLSDTSGTVTLDGHLVMGTACEIDPRNDLIIEGDIRCEAISGVRALSIPAHGQFTGQVYGESAVIEGRLSGRVVVEGVALVRNTAQIRGEVAAGLVKVEHGTDLENCVLSGRIQRAG